MQTTIDQLPEYLRKYTVTQSSNQYTARDHAAWRYIMRQSRAYFQDHAVPIYLEGLQRTGISFDHIPDIATMDEKLQRLGWRAVPVRGFIPPAAFLEMQASRILPIACDMRSVDHIAYTPAPDIVHEAAGHAPILADPAYSEYLTHYAEMAKMAIFSADDLAQYEAIRTLSDIKENFDSTPAMIAAAELALTEATRRITYVSEASKVARMNWWTVEYGLLGSLTAPKIYGAGLLSSVGESQNCLSPQVKKHRLTVACADTSYDITEPQPQLFVAEDIGHLRSVLKEFEATLSFKRGGTYGLAEARQAQTVTTTVLDSGLQISGRLTEFTTVSSHGDTRAVFLRYQGPVQLAVKGRALAGQGTDQHPSGYSTPLGRLDNAPTKPMAHLTDDELRALGLVVGARCRIRLTSGYEISGHVVAATRQDGKLVVLKWRDCTVVRGGETLFAPAWGEFDMGVGEQVVSVFGGPADRTTYGSLDIGEATTSPARQSPFTAEELSVFAAYATMRQMRDAKTSTPAPLLEQAETVAKRYPKEWLLRLESLELLAQRVPSAHERTEQLRTQLIQDAAGLGADVPWLVRQGSALAATPDA